MGTITASMVKSLREVTGAGMMDCKTALNENNGDQEAAIDWLRTKGLSKAAKKADRVAAEGLVAVKVSENKGVVIEVNSETDFVARNETFQGMVKDIVGLSFELDGDYDSLLKADYLDIGKTVQEHVVEMVGTIGENMNLRRSVGISVSEGVVSAYIHGQVAENQGRIGVLVALESSGDKEKLYALGKQISMHIAATHPLALSVEELDQAEVTREREVLIAEARESGKPEAIIEKMVEGRIRKFYEEVVLLQQTFVVDGETTIEKVVENASKDIGQPIKLKGFIRFELGEGIEKAPQEDFAAEVAATIGS